jgi:PAS domain-containing protein
MVADLYSPQFSVLGFSCLALTVVGATAAYIAHLPWLMIFVAVALSAIGGVGLLVRWRRRAPDSAPPQVWDERFERLSWISAGAVGLMVGLGLAATDDIRAHVVLIAMMLGAVSTTVRNYCRPRVVIGQLAGLILPGVVAFALKFDPLYLVLALLGIGLAREMPRFCLSLHRRMIDALVAEESRSLQNKRFDAALSHMTHGLCMYDRDWRLVVCNQAYLDIFDLSPEVVKPGAMLMDLYVHAIERGLYPGKTPEELMTATTAQLAQGAMVVTQTLGDGRIISVSRGRPPTAAGSRPSKTLPSARRPRPRSSTWPDMTF